MAKIIGRQDYEQMYKGVKKEYDLLLEKNQNDLVRIKIKEKTLNERIEAVRAEKQQQIFSLKEEIQYLKAINKTNLQDQKEKLNSHHNYISDNSSTENLRQIISKQQKEIKQLGDRVKTLIIQKQRAEKKIDQLNKQVDDSKKREAIQLQQKQKQLEQLQSKYIAQIADASSNLAKAQNRIKQLKQDLTQYYSVITEQQQIASQNQYKLNDVMSQLQKKQQCSRCQEFEKEIELHKQMLKSVRTILKFKQIELQKLKQLKQ